MNSKQREPLFHIVKRSSFPIWKKLLLYAGAVVLGLLITSIICVISSDGHNPFELFSSMFAGVFGTERRIWIFLRDVALLLAVSLALIPAFRMKFWNLGGNGQILISALVCFACMRSMGGKLPGVIYYPLLVILSVGAAMVWALIPAIFKAIFKTNESLFTLMMNYIASGLITIMITVWAPNGSGSLDPINQGTLPDIINNHLPTIITAVALTVFMYFYLNKSKQGYELALVGESENTAKYAGMKVKFVIIRTLLISGAICGIVGLLLTASINHTVSTSCANNMGFTAIMTAWLAKFNPLTMIGTCGLIVFISQGMGQVRKDFSFYNDALANLVLGIIYFFVIGCEFFINYKIIFRNKKFDEKVVGGVK